jgi:hypothetical protein
MSDRPPERQPLHFGNDALVSSHKLDDAAFIWLYPTHGLILAALAWLFEGPLQLVAVGLIHSFGSMVTTYRMPFLVTMDLLPEHVVLRGVRAIRLGYSDFTTRRGSGRMRSQTPHPIWRLEWEGPPSEDSCAILITYGSRKFCIPFDSKASADEAEAALRERQNPKTVYR